MLEKINTGLRLNTKVSRSFSLSVISTIIFLIVCAFGEGLVANYGGNASCYKYLGCDSGFFGYDAIEHFLFGMAGVWTIIWIFKKFPKYSTLQDKRWKNFLVFIALITFIAVLWEFLECAHDFFRVEVLRQSLFSFRLHINQLDQPNNLDTMGDLSFSVLGSIIALIFSGL